MIVWWNSVQFYLLYDIPRGDVMARERGHNMNLLNSL